MKARDRKHHEKYISNDTKIKKQMKSSSGITLIALVTAVIIIMILATVGLRQAFGDNGLLTKTEKTQTEAEQDITNSQQYIDKTQQEYLNATTFAE